MFVSGSRLVFIATEDRLLRDLLAALLVIALPTYPTEAIANGVDPVGAVVNSDPSAAALRVIIPLTPDSTVPVSNRISP